VSHNLRAVSEICRDCVWLQAGQIVQIGPAAEVVAAYVGADRRYTAGSVIGSDAHINPTGHVFFRWTAVLDAEGMPTTSIPFGSPLRVAMRIEVCRPVENMRLAVAVERWDGTLVTILHHTDGRQELLNRKPGFLQVELVVQLDLMPGSYSIHLGAKPAPGYWGSGMSWDWVQRALDFSVSSVASDGEVCLPNSSLVRPRGTWGFRDGLPAPSTTIEEPALATARYADATNTADLPLRLMDNGRS
jgi:hypothetical protein